MENVDRSQTTQTLHASWFVIVGFFAFFVAMVGLPTIAAVVAPISGWAALGALVLLAGLVSLAVVETWKHLGN